MANKVQKTDKGAKLSDESVDDILDNVDIFIEGVYRDLSRFETLRSSSSSNVSVVNAVSLPVLSSDDESRNMVSPTTRVNMDAEIERINRMCDSVDKSLRSIGVFMNNSGNSNSSGDHLNTSLSPSTRNVMFDLSIESTPLYTTASSSLSRRPSCSEPRAEAIPAEIIDLSETQSQTSLILENNNNNNGTDDDDVILVSANINPVVNLCTPVNKKATTTRRRIPIDQFDYPDVEIVEDCPTARSRRNSIKRKSLDACVTEEQDKNNKKSPSADNMSSGPTPFMCSVCMDSCLQRQPTSTKCGHIFCNECICQTIRITQKCPLCKTKISHKNIFRIYP